MAYLDLLMEVGSEADDKIELNDARLMDDDTVSY